MRNLIKKILKEDFDWIGNGTLDLPMEEIKEFADNYEDIIQVWVDKINAVEDKLPKQNWDNPVWTDELLDAEGLRDIRHQLINIQDSLVLIRSNWAE